LLTEFDLNENDNAYIILVMGRLILIMNDSLYCYSKAAYVVKYVRGSSYSTSYWLQFTTAMYFVHLKYARIE